MRRQRDKAAKEPQEQTLGAVATSPLTPSTVQATSELVGVYLRYTSESGKTERLRVVDYGKTQKGSEFFVVEGYEGQHEEQTIPSGVMWKILDRRLD